MLAWAALFLSVVPGPEPRESPTLEQDVPPVLTAPEAARKKAALNSISQATRAELSLLAHDPVAALRHARDATDLSPPRRLRLMADARVQLGHNPEAEALLAKLEAHPGWGRHVTRQRFAMEVLGRVRMTTRAGLALYALALGALVLGGTRALLRPDVPTAIMLALTVVALFVARITWPPLGVAAGLAGLGASFLVHAGAATLSRLEAGLGARRLVASVVVLGTVGGWAALAAALARAVWTG